MFASLRSTYRPVHKAALSCGDAEAVPTPPALRRRRGFEKLSGVSDNRRPRDPHVASHVNFTTGCEKLWVSPWTSFRATFTHGTAIPE